MLLTSHLRVNPKVYFRKHVIITTTIIAISHQQTLISEKQVNYSKVVNILADKIKVCTGQFGNFNM